MSPLPELDEVDAFAPGTGAYPRRLIEADFPIGVISENARDGRSVHHGHITAIHIWWARKPLPSCRAAILAAALIDPASRLAPSTYRAEVAAVLADVFGPDAAPLEDVAAVHRGLLRFVSEFSAWKRACDPEFLRSARRLVAAAKSTWGGLDLLLADPFSGGGSIPLEALRVGISAYASDLNPVAAIISKVTLEFVQKFGGRLMDAVTYCGRRIGQEARRELSRFYPPGQSGRSAAYIWFRTIRCEGPRCGAEVPLTSKFHLERSGARSIGFRPTGIRKKRPEFEIAQGPLNSFPEPSVRRGAATCLHCGYTTPVERIREQPSAKRGGAAGARLVAVVDVSDSAGRTYRLPSAVDEEAVVAAVGEMGRRERGAGNGTRGALLPDEPLPPIGTLGFRVQRYGMVRWRDLFAPRQLLALSTFARLVNEAAREESDVELGAAIRACLALVVDRLADHLNTGCSWNPSGGALPHLFTRQALPIIWDFGEANPFGGASGDWDAAVDHVVRGLRNAHVGEQAADVARASAGHHPLPTDCAHLLVTDPPYYDAIPYADLSDFFYVWLRRMLGEDFPDLFRSALVPRDDECIVNPVAGKDRVYFRRVMTDAMTEARRVTRPDGVGVIVFAHKSTAGWEDQLSALIDAGWIITASWPIDTENASRLRARDSAVLASSIHLVCRPRERPDGTLITDTVGEWRDVIANLPKRIKAWMPRLAREGIVGADAIFSCIGPALELYSRYARVEKASGEPVPLREYLEQVWAAVAQEALSMSFTGANASGFEADARLTAMWLWTLSTGGASAEAPPPDAAEEVTDAADHGVSGGDGSWLLEFDAARKIAQGLGVRLEQLQSVVEVAGDIARLIPVAERAGVLLSDRQASMAAPKKALKGGQLALSLLATPAAVSSADIEDPRTSSIAPGETVLDRLHQTMLLFAAGRSESVRRFLVEDGVGRDGRFWQLAQALSALYPTGSSERRWVDGVLARKKGLGL